MNTVTGRSVVGLDYGVAHDSGAYVIVDGAGTVVGRGDLDMSMRDELNGRVCCSVCCEELGLGEPLLEKHYKRTGVCKAWMRRLKIEREQGLVLLASFEATTSAHATMQAEDYVPLVRKTVARVPVGRRSAVGSFQSISWGVFVEPWVRAVHNRATASVLLACNGDLEIRAAVMAMVELGQSKTGIHRALFPSKMTAGGPCELAMDAMDLDPLP